MNAPDRQFEYTHTLWGEVVRGTKSELQALGIAVGMAFPGGLGGPKRKMRANDPRGFATTVDCDGDRRYCACITFPGREEEPKRWSDFAPGVKMSSHYQFFDDYVGTAEALAAAGLVRIDQLPGQPGARKVKVTIFADGTVPSGPPTAYDKRASEIGAKTIVRATKTTFSVRVIVDENTQMARLELQERARREYEARMRALPRPAPLTSAMPLPERLVKGHLSLVWSAKVAHSKFDGFRL